MTTPGEFFAKYIKPGSVILTTGDRGGGKTHSTVFLCEQFVKGVYPEMGKVVVATNIIFFHKVNGRIVEEPPEGVYHIDTMKELFKVISESIRKYGRQVRIILVLDEAQNFIGGDNNSTNESIPMKIFLGTIRKYSLAVWFLTPVANKVGPSFRNYIHGDPSGDVTLKIKKDPAVNLRYCMKHGLNWDPNQMIAVRADEGDVKFLRMGRSEWTKTHEDLKEGEYCYDHESNARFKRGDGFDWEEFNDLMGGVSSLRQIEVMEKYFRDKEKESEEKEESFENDPEYQKLKLIADMYLVSDLTWTDICARYGYARTTLTDKLKKYGLWTEEFEKKSRKKSLKKSDKQIVYPDVLSVGTPGGRRSPEIYISSPAGENGASGHPPSDKAQAFVGGLSGFP